MNMQEKIAQVLENETLLKANQRLSQEKESLLKGKDLSDGQIGALTKSLETLQGDLKHKEDLVVPIPSKRLCQTVIFYYE